MKPASQLLNKIHKKTHKAKFTVVIDDKRYKPSLAVECSFVFFNKGLRTYDSFKHLKKTAYTPLLFAETFFLNVGLGLLDLAIMALSAAEMLYRVMTLNPKAFIKAGKQFIESLIDLPIRIIENVIVALAFITFTPFIALGVSVTLANTAVDKLIEKCFTSNDEALFGDDISEDDYEPVSTSISLQGYGSVSMNSQS